MSDDWTSGYRADIGYTHGYYRELSPLMLEFVGTYTVTDDALGSENITLTGADAALFETSAGNIYLKAGVLLDFEGSNPTLDFVVNAQDPLVGGIISSSAQSITVTDAAPLLVSTNFSNVAENSTSVGNVVDITGDHSGVIYGISNSDDGAFFTVDAAGNLSFIAAPDFENPLDVGKDNSYTVTVTADDGNGNLAAQAYTFSVTDVAGSTFTGNNSNNTLNGTSEADTINGLGGNDTLNGLAGNDVINGGSGSDTMSGGAGSDTYFVDNTADKAIENFGEGTDTINSTVTFTLGANVENLVLQGTSNRNGTGNTLDNTLTGNTGNNVLKGLDGADTLTGGLGKDTMTGGVGNDTFDFNAIAESRLRPNHDIITDFSNGDLIDLSDIAGINAVSGVGGIVANSVSWALVGSNTIISIETTGNGVADMEIMLTGNKLAILDAGDFII
jgi:Ca2+-binding RTX toxin-like protein